MHLERKLYYVKRNKMYPVENTPHLQPWEAQMVRHAHANGKAVYIVDAKLPYARIRLHEEGKAAIVVTVDTSLYDTVESLYEEIEKKLKEDM